MRGLYRRSRVIRVLCWLLVLAPLTQILEFFADNDLRKYTATGDAIGLAAWMLFAVWAWWYAEDRERRHEAKAHQTDSATSNEHGN